MMEGTTELGYINTCIAGDRRYSSRLRVLVEGATAHVVLEENGAVGGMDGPGGSTPFSETRRLIVQANPGDILRAIRRTMDETIKRYGKPSKSFVWSLTREHGLSEAKCRRALEAV